MSEFLNDRRQLVRLDGKGSASDDGVSGVPYTYKNGVHLKSN